MSKCLKAGAKCILLTAISVIAISASAADKTATTIPVPKGQSVVKEFNYSGVTLDSGFLRAQYDQVRNDYMRIPNDDLLHGFRVRAGKPAPGVELGGWYTEDIGNNFGQIISGLARMYAATGDVAAKEKVIALVHGWGECIEPDGYSYYTKKAPSKAYVYDKMVGGLTDAYVYCDDQEALTHLSKITNWAEKNLNRIKDYANADGEASPRCNWSEWYTLSENLYRAYLATGDTRYRDFAKVWEYTEFWDIFANKGDIFGVRANGQQTREYHAYSHVNTFSGAGAAYLVSGDSHYLDVLRNAYDFIQTNEVYATGGYGPNEQLMPHDQVVKMLSETGRHFETQCGSWAAFKMSKYLISFTGDAKYGDWIEKLVYNGIGASLPMNTDGYVFYYSDYHTGEANKGYYGAAWPCCAGTRPMAVADYHNLVYFKGPKDLYVNLYTPATVHWNIGKSVVTVQQKTRFPEEPATEFTVSVQKPTEFGLKLRVPEWLASPMTASVNGENVSLTTDTNHWTTVNRKWKDGDKLTVTLPMKLWVSRIDPNKPYPAAIMYGPVTLAVRSPKSNPTSEIDLEHLDKTLVKSDGEALTYHLASDPNVLVRPFYMFKEGEKYFLYLDPEGKARE